MTTVRLRDDALEWRIVEDEVVAVDLAAREYFSVSRTGAALWPALAEGTTPDALANTLVERFEVDRPTALADVERLLSDLRARGLLES